MGERDRGVKRLNLEIANRLVALRREQGFSQESLAARLGVSRQAVSKWERAESSPDTDNLIALARLYGISLDLLLLSEDRGYADAAVQYAPEPEPEARTQRDEDEELFAVSAQWDQEEEVERRERRARVRHGFLVFPYPVLLTIIYLATGFMFDWWHPGWIIFLTIPLYYCFFGAVMGGENHGDEE